MARQPPLELPTCANIYHHVIKIFLTYSFSIYFACGTDETSQTKTGSVTSHDNRDSNTGQKDTEKKSSNKDNTGSKKANDFLTLKPTDAEKKSDVDSLDLSDIDDPSEDLFEMARRKYNITLDSDDDL